jgi:hypothetical protein
MRVSFLLFGAVLGAIATGAAAQAQVVMTVGSGLAHDCFVHAKSGNQLREGVVI